MCHNLPVLQCSMLTVAADAMVSMCIYMYKLCVLYIHVISCYKFVMCTCMWGPE